MLQLLLELYIKGKALPFLIYSSEKGSLYYINGFYLKIRVSKIESFGYFGCCGYGYFGSSVYLVYSVYFSNLLLYDYRNYCCSYSCSTCYCLYFSLSSGKRYLLYPF